MIDTLTIYLEKGETLRFHNVSGLEVDKRTKEITFGYFGLSTQRENKATFLNVAGYSISI